MNFYFHFYFYFDTDAQMRGGDMARCWIGQPRNDWIWRAADRFHCCSIAVLPYQKKRTRMEASLKPLARRETSFVWIEDLEGKIAFAMVGHVAPLMLNVLKDFSVRQIRTLRLDLDGHFQHRSCYRCKIPRLVALMMVETKPWYGSLVRFHVSILIVSLPSFLIILFLAFHRFLLLIIWLSARTGLRGEISVLLWLLLLFFPVEYVYVQYSVRMTAWF